MCTQRVKYRGGFSSKRWQVQCQTQHGEPNKNRNTVEDNNLGRLSMQATIGLSFRLHRWPREREGCIDSNERKERVRRLNGRAGEDR